MMHDNFRFSTKSILEMESDSESLSDLDSIGDDSHSSDAVSSSRTLNNERSFGVSFRVESDDVDGSGERGEGMAVGVSVRSS